MNNAHLIAGIIGVFLSVIIYMLVRRDHLSPNVAARWFLVAMLVLTLGVSPGIVDYLGEKLGVGYPPILVVILAISAALIKILLMDIERQKMKTKVDRLVQKIAILEAASLSSSNIDKSDSNKKIIDFDNKKKASK